MIPAKLRWTVAVAAVWGGALMAAPQPAAPDWPALIAQAAQYESGQSRQALDQLEALARASVSDRALRVALEAALTNLLAPTATAEARRFACQQLAVIGTDNCLPAVAGLLQQPTNVPLACYVLSIHPSRQAGELLRNALLTVPGTNRIPIIDALGHRREAEAAKTIANLTDYADPEVARAAILALGKIACPPALDTLAQLRREGKAQTLRAAVEASLTAADLISGSNPSAALAIYTELNHPDQPPFIRRAAFEGLLRVEPKAAQQRVLAALRDKDAALKPSAIAAVRTLPGANVSRTFAAELPRLTPDEQVLLIGALAARNDAGARQAIEGQLAATNPAVRLAAIQALGAVGDATTVPLLVKAIMRSPTQAEVTAIENALVNLAGADAVDRALIEQLPQAAKGAKPTLISALGKRGNRLAVDALLTEAGSTEAAVAQAAFHALGRLATAEDLPKLIDRLLHLKAPAARDAAEDAVAKALANTPEPAQRAEAVCAALAKAGDLETRLALIRLLPSCGSAQALGTLVSLVSDPDPQVRDTAVRAVAEWPDASAWAVLAGLYQQPANETHRVLALRALVRLATDLNAQPNAVLIERYRALLEGARSDDDRKLILGALSGCASPEALKLALPLLEQPALKSEAAMAVKKIAEAIKAQHPQAAEQALQKLK